MSGDALEKYYREELEERLILHLAAVKGISLEEAMDGYYRSRLAKKIYQGLDDVQYLANSSGSVFIRMRTNTL